MRKVAVIGVGQTKFGGAQEKTGVELFSEAATDALQESNLKPKDIQAMFVGNVLGDFSEGQGTVQAFAAENIGCFNIPTNRYEGACASASMAVRDAFMWVASGFYDIVIAGGVERAATLGTPMATRTFAMFSDSRYEFPAGITFPGVFAMLAHLYAATYGIPIQKLREQMAAVSVQSCKYGAQNPKGQFFGKVRAALKKEGLARRVLVVVTAEAPAQREEGEAVTVRGPRRRVAREAQRRRARAPRLAGRQDDFAEAHPLVVVERLGHVVPELVRDDERPTRSHEDAGEDEVRGRGELAHVDGACVGGVGGGEAHDVDA